MLKRHKDLLRPIVSELRAILLGGMNAEGPDLRGDLDRELDRLGIAPDGTRTPLDALPNPTPAEHRARAATEAILAAAIDSLPRAQRTSSDLAAPQKQARKDLVERAAYSWINRLLALRAMEARGLIDETLRQSPDYGGISEALFVLRETEPARCVGADSGWWAVITDACAAQATALPGLFDPRDPLVALRPSTSGLLRCVAVIGGAPAGFTQDEADAAFADPDAIGWAYQFYQEPAKAHVYAKLGSGGKAASRAEIAAATQLFTEPYMVQWLLQNSLGRAYHEAYPDSALPATWDYYIRQRPEGQTAPESPRPLAALDLLDPCCGSGHFLRAAFDLFVAMYREQQPDLPAAMIADRILRDHLFGIDLDPRAAQLAALTLYLRAWELVRAERRQRRQPGPGSYQPPVLNVATTPSGLSAGMIERHLRRHPQDRALRPLLEGIFTALEQADILGALLRPSEHIDAAIKAIQQPHTVPLEFDADDAALGRMITQMARHDPTELKRLLLERVAGSFAAEAGDDDVAAALFGREAERGVRLLQVLDRRYSIVTTNPPYMGSKNMDPPLKKYVERHYSAGKRDLYAAFILRCLGLCRREGRVAMITLHTFLTATSFMGLRKLILQSSRIESATHLGTGTLKSLSNPNAQGFCMYVLQLQEGIEHQNASGIFIRLVGVADKEEALLNTLHSPSYGGDFFVCNNAVFKDIPEYQIIYHLNDRLLEKFKKGLRLCQLVSVKQGLATADDYRCLRFFWEIVGNVDNSRNKKPRFLNFTKGGGPARWAGQTYYMCEWQYQGARLRARSSTRLQNEHAALRPFYSYSLISGGICSVRVPDQIGLFGHKGPAILPPESWDEPNGSLNKTLWVQPLLQSRVATYLLRAMSSGLAFEVNTMANLPVPEVEKLVFTNKPWLNLKWLLVGSNLVERTYNIPISLSSKNQQIHEIVAILLSIGEAWIDSCVFIAYELDNVDIDSILSETGTPAGFHPLIRGYDALPDLPAELKLPPLPQAVLDYLATHRRIAPATAELARMKARLRALYEAGPGAKDESADEAEPAGAGEGDEEDATVSGAHIPIPTETFLEELSVKMQIHPISVYWLLEELRSEGARCKPEELRLLEDRLSVLVLRLLGHRWPKQIEAREPVPEWADRDGIIPIITGTGEPSLVEQVRARLRADEGDLGVQRTEALLHELTDLSLEEWLRRQFFPRHVRQFKYRPVAWHLSSSGFATGGKRRGIRRTPAFECLLYYHASDRNALTRLRTQYVEPLLRAERQRLEDARRTEQETAAAQAIARIQELEGFAGALRTVAEQGFACPELERLLADEPLDRWSGDGYLSPPSPDDLLRQELSWRVDLNDGVRVNIAPLQLAGLLVSDMLKPVDARKALADRARWRSDERRWVRAGKLPRCGWMPDDVPESQRWTDLAPQREAERVKLDEKRRRVLASAEDE